MEPTTCSTRADRTTWKHWAGVLAFLAFLTIGVPLIASLPLPVALPIATTLAAAIMMTTRAIAKAHR